MHLRRWGAVYLLAALFLSSWVGQYVAQVAEGDGWTLFLSNTFENWQSEFLQLGVQALLIVGAAGKLFRVSKDDSDEIKGRLDRLERMIANQIRAGQNPLKKEES